MSNQYSVRLFIPLAALPLLLLAACGGSGSPAAAVGSGPEGMEAFTACLEEHGAELPQARTGGAPPSDFDAAREACADLLPGDLPPDGATSGGGPGGPGGGSLDESAFAAYRSCMSDHGVTIPEGKAGAPPQSIARDDADFKAANGVCSPLLSSATRPQGVTP